MPLPEIFRDTHAFHNAFVAGLGHMLEHEDGLGVFILVLANANYDDSIYKALQVDLRARYADLVKAYQRKLRDEPDDIQVFEQLMNIGFDKLKACESRQLGPWCVQFNSLRSFRPSRISDIRVDSLSLPFNIDSFHFNKTFLKKEILWQGKLLGSFCCLLYNKFPFADRHGILVIEPKQERPQVLTGESHQYIWQLCEILGQGMPAVGFGYNAYGAAASVNHQHFQMYVRKHGSYPLENSCWQHHGGAEVYPVDCIVKTDSISAWQVIEDLHASNTAYNLLYRPGLMYILPRRMQGHFSYSPALTGMGWADVAGEVTAASRTDYERIDSEQLAAELRRAAL